MIEMTDEELPPLPQAFLVMMTPDPEGTPAAWYDERDMREYARACIAAHEAKKQQVHLVSDCVGGTVPGDAATPSNRWAGDGETDPHGSRYDCERAALCMGDLTDDELANGAFLNYDNLDVQALVARKPGYHPPIAWMTAVKDRIRWLSRKVVALEAKAGASVAQAGEPLQWFVGKMLFDFQQATGCDTAEEFLAERAAMNAQPSAKAALDGSTAAPGVPGTHETEPKGGA